ncbi:MAG: hypothetical protein MJ056_05645 [Akkermansia sp.]|nr:hypothetical protein [Akkermansia sp.]
MKTQTILTLAALACMPALAQQPAPQPQQQRTPASAAQSIINQMGITTNALVDVLQGVTDKATADAAAREVGEIIVQLKLLNDLAGYALDFAQDIEAMRQAQVNALMPMLMNTNPCYGSEAMLKALAPVVTIRQAQPEQQAQPEPQPESVVQQPEPQPQPEPAVQQPAPQPQPQAVNPQNNAAQQTAAAILEGYRNLAAVLEGVHDKASADAAAPQAAQVIATILPLYDQAENSDELADFVGVQIAQTEEIDTLSDILENLLQAEPALYGSEALSATLANIVTVEEIQEEAPQQPVEEQPAPVAQPQPAPAPQPAYNQEYDEEEYEEEAPSAILAPMQQQ